MNINIKGTNFDLTESLRVYTSQKIQDLSHLLPGGMENANVFVELGRTTLHHNKGDVFRAEIIIKMPGSSLRAESSAADVYAAIDMVKDELHTEILKFKNKKDALYKRGWRKIKNLMRFSGDGEERL